MKLCNRDDIRSHIDGGDLRVAVACGDVVFLDEFRIGLRLRDCVSSLDGDIDLGGRQPPLRSFSLKERGLPAHQLILGQSVEEFSIPAGLIGFMNTRSKYARLGLEMMQSSWFMAPGFGQDRPTPVVFEMRSEKPICGFSEEEPYAFLMLFALARPVALDGRDFGSRFPLDAWKEG
jgi:deoxycytidine triphosphate deaminase